MDMMAILQKKSRPAYTVSIDQSIDDAINLMAAKKINALIVTDANQPVGIFAERDVFQYCLSGNKEGSSDIKLNRLMTGRLISAEPTDDVSDILTLMMRSDLDHLPVLEGNKILGLVALKDLAENQLESLTSEIQQLNDYINDLHEAGQD